MTHTSPRYLIAKETVDARARSDRVAATVRSHLPASPRIVEIGCGTGRFLPELLSWDIGSFEYLGLDRDGDLIAFARALQPKAIRARGHEVVETTTGGHVGETTFRFLEGDALSALPNTTADLVIGQAFLDLVPIEPALDAIDAALEPGGVAYFPITFDGATIFRPAHPADELVERAYHDAIDAQPGRSSTAGRELLDRHSDRGREVLAVESSDWIVYPRAGEYPADEQYFLERILGFVDSEVVGRHGQTDTGGDQLTKSLVDDWLETRRAQLQAGELVYVAHQYDVCIAGPIG